MPITGVPPRCSNREEAEFDFLWCATCRQYVTFHWVKSLRIWECEDDTHHYGENNEMAGTG